MNERRWKTSISMVEKNRILLRGYRIQDLIGRLSFAQAVFLAFKGELPDDVQTKMIDAVLVSCVDHGTTPQSTVAAVAAASAGSPLNAAVAAGVLAISRHHGGAIEECMIFLMEAAAMADQLKAEPTQASRAITKKYRSAQQRIPGYGHLLHTTDPRTERLFQLASEIGLSNKYITMARHIEVVLEEESERKLPLNADGAIAAVLLEVGIAPELANGFFIISRLPGLIAHIHEERARYKPLRRIDPYNAEYDGPPERKYPE